ncbi:hypothetical protein [Mameliella alba]|uniref:hypothetical protein n=1 Tax=Mameliella alba TaxID=561184 RepID=UPI001430DC4B|nr:hypothetical protein [Mameliella alba]
MGVEDISLRQFVDLQPNGRGQRVIRWAIARSYDERMEILEEALNDCYRFLVDVRGLNRKHGEDELSMQVVQMLNMTGIAAQHDRHVNGHCDVVVEHDSGFMWLGEAKIHRDYGWLEDGFLQLSTRYGTSMKGRDHGELIIYHRGSDSESSKSVLEQWKKRLGERHPEAKVILDRVDEELFFRTEHPCKNSGRAFYVRHIIIPLRHSPEK